MIKDCISAVQDISNSGVCGSSVSRGYLDERTTRIDEATARKLHPALFAFLDFQPHNAKVNLQFESEYAEMISKLSFIVLMAISSFGLIVNSDSPWEALLAAVIASIVAMRFL